MHERELDLEVVEEAIALAFKKGVEEGLMLGKHDGELFMCRLVKEWIEAHDHQMSLRRHLGWEFYAHAQKRMAEAEEQANNIDGGKP